MKRVGTGQSNSNGKAITSNSYTRNGSSKIGSTGGEKQTLSSSHIVGTISENTPPISQSLWGDSSRVTGSIRNNALSYSHYIERALDLQSNSLGCTAFSRRDKFEIYRLLGSSLLAMGRALHYLSVYNKSVGLYESLSNANQNENFYAVLKRLEITEIVRQGSRNIVKNRDDIMSVAPAYVGLIDIKCGSTISHNLVKTMYPYKLDNIINSEDLKAFQQIEPSFVEDIERMFSYTFKAKGFSVAPLSLHMPPNQEPNLYLPDLSTLGILILAEYGARAIKLTPWLATALSSRESEKIQSELVKDVLRAIMNSTLGVRIGSFIKDQIDFETSINLFLPDEVMLRYLAVIYLDGGHSKLLQLVHDSLEVNI